MKIAKLEPFLFGTAFVIALSFADFRGMFSLALIAARPVLILVALIVLAALFLFSEYVVYDEADQTSIADLRKRLEPKLDGGGCEIFVTRWTCR